MRRYLLLAATLCLLAACGGNTATPILALGDACNTFANALDKLTPVKPTLTPATVNFVNSAIALTSPICSSGTAPASIADAIALVSGEASAILGIVTKGN